MIDNWEGERVDPAKLTTERLEEIKKVTVDYRDRRIIGAPEAEYNLEQIDEELDSRDDSLWVEATVVSQHKECSYNTLPKLRCRCRANSTVDQPGHSDARFYRCVKHEGQWDDTTLGIIRYTMQVRKGEVIQ